jgi:hypothetical protein
MTTFFLSVVMSERASSRGIMGRAKGPSLGVVIIQMIFYNMMGRNFA